MILKFTLPWPPSVNRVWRHVGAKVLLSEESRSYRKAVGDAVLVGRIPRFALKGRLACELELCAPNQRRWDTDNRVKAVWDSLVKAGVLEDDSNIHRFSVTRGPIVQGGEVHVVLSELDQAA